MTQIIRFPKVQSDFGFTPQSRSKPASIIEGPGLIDRIDLIQQLQKKAILPLADIMQAHAVGGLLGGHFCLEWESQQKCVRVPNAAEMISERYHDRADARKLLYPFCKSAVEYEDHMVSNSQQIWLFHDAEENKNSSASLLLLAGSRSIKWEAKDALVPNSPINSSQEYPSLRPGIDAMFAFLDAEPCLRGLSFRNREFGEAGNTRAEFIKHLYRFSVDTGNGYSSRLLESLCGQLNTKETA